MVLPPRSKAVATLGRTKAKAHYREVVKKRGWPRGKRKRFPARAGRRVRNPAGPREEESFDPSEPGVCKRVHKGGSYLCTDQYCARYMPGARGKSAPDTGTNHLGFRCVMTAEIWERWRQARSAASK